MDKEDYIKHLEIIANERGLKDNDRKEFIDKNVDYMVQRSYFDWPEEVAAKQIEFLEQQVS